MIYQKYALTKTPSVSNSRTYLINILGTDICETGVAQGISADSDGGPLGTNRRTVGNGGTGLASGAARGQPRPFLARQ
jgi:hypothetical protein